MLNGNFLLLRGFYLELKQPIGDLLSAKFAEIEVASKPTLTKFQGFCVRVLDLPFFDAALDGATNDDDEVDGEVECNET